MQGHQHRAVGAVEDDARGASEGRARRGPWVGRVLGPVLAVVAYATLPATLATPARATAGVAVLMAVWWMSEALPLPATSLLPVVLFPLLSIAGIEAATRPYASDIIFLFGGGFVLAQAVERWGLHRRIALRTVLLVGTSPRRLVGGFMLAAAGLSMWVSNTATTVMMLPIGVSVLTLVADHLESEGVDVDHSPAWAGFGTALMLAIAYAASIGSVATLIGTPPNGILAGYLAQQGTPIGFGRWMLLGLPLAVVFLLIAWLLLTRLLFRLGARGLPGGEELMRAELRDCGPVGRGERLTIGVFLVVALLWVLRPALQGLPGLDGLSDAGIAIAGAVALFLAPVDARRGVMALDWEHAKRIPWGILLLFGGGLSLAAAIEDTGLAAFIGEQVTGLDHLALPLLVVVVSLVVVFLTEVTSNTAAAALFVPVLGGAALVLGIDPLLLVVPATLVATFAFMLPVATPPNAIVFSSGHLTVAQMARTGIVLNLVGVALSSLAVFTLASWVFGTPGP